MRYAVHEIAKQAQLQQSVTRPHDSTAFQHFVEIQFVLLLLLDVGQCTLTFVLSFLRKRPRRIIVGERWLIWDQWHDGQGVVVASCLEKTPTATVNIQYRMRRKGRHRLAYCCYNSSIRVGRNSSRHARTHYVRTMLCTGRRVLDQTPSQEFFPR